MLNINIPVLAATLLVVFFGMGLHEYGHALMADYWGDPTPRRLPDTLHRRFDSPLQGFVAWSAMIPGRCPGLA